MQEIRTRCTEPMCPDDIPHGYSSPDDGYEGCPAHTICTDPDCEYRAIHVDMMGI